MQRKNSKNKNTKRKANACFLLAALLLIAQPAVGIKACQAPGKKTATASDQNQSAEPEDSQKPERTQTDEFGKVITDTTETDGLGAEAAEYTGTDKPDQTDPGTAGIDNSTEEIAEATGSDNPGEETTETTAEEQSETLIETEGWVMPNNAAKYCCKQEGNVIYCYMQENTTRIPSLSYIMGIETSASSSVAANPLPCENPQTNTKKAFISPYTQVKLKIFLMIY